MKKNILSVVAFIASSLTVLVAQAQYLQDLAGRYQGQDQLNRPCEVFIAKSQERYSFVATNFTGEEYTVNDVKVISIENDLVLDEQTPGNAYVNHYQYFGRPSLFGTYPETRQVMIRWSEELVSTVLINIDRSQGPYAQRSGLMCMNLRSLPN